MPFLPARLSALHLVPPHPPTVFPQPQDTVGAPLAAKLISNPLLWRVISDMEFPPSRILPDGRLCSLTPPPLLPKQCVHNCRNTSVSWQKGGIFFLCGWHRDKRRPIVANSGASEHFDMPDAHVINLQTRTHAIHGVSHEHTHMHACTQWEAAFWRRLATIRGFFPPSTGDPLPGQAWKEVTFSKVCLNRDDMWMCWHETAALGSPPPHLTPLPEKQPRLFSFPSFFLFSSLPPPPPKSSSLPEKTESLFVLMVVPFLRFIPT